MKRAFLYILVLLASVIGASAQEAIYVYRNDGGFDAFLREDVDSITCSRIGVDSLYHADWQMQLVHTPDSIYRIPLAVIDSVGFVTPEPVLSADVFLLTSAHDAYLQAADTLSFVLAAATPASMRPSRGNVVVSACDCMSFPHGIMARVLSMAEADGGGIKYVCEKARLEDVYDRLVLCEKCVADDMRDTPVRSKAFGEVDTSRDYTLWDRTFDKTISTDNTNTHVNVRDIAGATVTIRLLRGQPSYFRLDLRNRFQSSFDFSAGLEAESGHEFPVGEAKELPRIPIPGTVLWFTPTVSLKSYFLARGEVNLDFAAHLDRSDAFSFVYKGGEWSYHHVPRTDVGVDVASFSVRGSVEVGLRPDLLFGLCGSATGLGLTYSVGLKESAEFKFDALEYLENGGAYAALRDSYVRTTMPQRVNAYAQIGLFESGDRWDMPPFEVEPQWGDDTYLLPLFGEVASTVNNDARTVSLKADVSRDLLMPVELGFSIYEGEDKLIARKYLGEKYRRRQEWPSDGLQADFSDLVPGKAYTAYPTVRIMGTDLTASSSEAFKVLVVACPDENHPHLIDLGLPSGTRWACCNVGAHDPAGFGDYFAWGETVAKQEFKDCVTQGKELDDISGDAAYDAARANWGSPWRMPTKEEIDELQMEARWTWVSQGGYNGILLKGPSGGSIFLPAAGWYDWSGLHGTERFGCYWSSTPYPFKERPEYNNQAGYFYFYDMNAFTNWYPRGNGYPVRAVSSFTVNGSPH